jgi:hypothetical protein
MSEQFHEMQQPEGWCQPFRWSEVMDLLMNQQEHLQFEIQGCPHCQPLRWGMDLELDLLDLAVMGPENEVTCITK